MRNGFHPGAIYLKVNRRQVVLTLCVDETVLEPPVIDACEDEHLPYQVFIVQTADENGTRTSVDDGVDGVVLDKNTCLISVLIGITIAYLADGDSCVVKAVKEILLDHLGLD